MAKQWLIRYYLNEGAYKTGCPAFTETVNGDRNFAGNNRWRQKLRYKLGAEQVEKFSIQILRFG